MKTQAFERKWISSGKSLGENHDRRKLNNHKIRSNSNNENVPSLINLSNNNNNNNEAADEDYIDGELDVSTLGPLVDISNRKKLGLTTREENLKLDGVRKSSLLLPPVRRIKTRNPSCDESRKERDHTVLTFLGSLMNRRTLCECEDIKTALTDGEVLLDLATMVAKSCGYRTSNNKIQFSNTFDAFAFMCQRSGLPPSLILHSPKDLEDTPRVLCVVAVLVQIYYQQGGNRNLTPPLALLENVTPPTLEKARASGALWVPDNFSTSCLLCDRSFSFFNRRHHCRACGTLVCGTCSNYKGKCLGYNYEEKICSLCAELNKQ